MIKKISVLVLAGIGLAYCKSDEKQPAQAATAETKALTKSENTDSLSFSVSQILSSYYKLKENFIQENDTAINSQAKQLAALCTQIPLNKMKADELIISTAKTNAEGVAAEIQGMLSEKTIEDKRKGFYTISEQIYDLIRTIQYDKEVIYHYKCDAAMGGNGAAWLSATKSTINPYLPKQKILCADITDSLDFSKK